MSASEQLNVFLNPKSVAVIGATERPGSWGSFIMEGLLSRPYPGRIYPVNRQAASIFGLRAYKSIDDISESPELAIFTIPEVSVEDTIRKCGQICTLKVSARCATLSQGVIPPTRPTSTCTMLQAPRWRYSRK